MRILALDQALGKTGFALAEDNILSQWGLIENKRLSDLAAVQYQTGEILKLIADTEPNFVLLEGVHYRRNAGTLIKLAGLLMHLRVEISYRGIAHEVIETNEIAKFLHLTPFTKRDKKAARVRRVVEDVIGREYANVFTLASALRGDEKNNYSISDDECSAIAAAHLPRAGQVSL